jgi:glycerophosphoryl diester phosphodiesterase
VRKLNPNIQTAYLWTKNDPLFIINSPLLAWWCKPDGFHADIDFLEEHLMKWIRRKKMSVLTFTVISQQQLSKALNLEVDGIIMDDPHLN